MNRAILIAVILLGGCASNDERYASLTCAEATAELRRAERNSAHTRLKQSIYDASVHQHNIGTGYQSLGHGIAVGLVAAHARRLEKVVIRACAEERAEYEATFYLLVQMYERGESVDTFTLINMANDPRATETERAYIQLLLSK